jgi:3alpha(or 20beta)-hydroxysteroid dehydrogenase
VTGRLQGKTALISGAARGQGEAEARLFVSEGAKVAVTDILDVEGQAVADSLGDAAIYRHLDVCAEDEWKTAVDAVEATWGRLDVLVNNAGIAVPPVALDVNSVHDHRRILDTNLNGVYLGMRAVVPLMTRQRSGSIINVSSIDGLVGVAGMTSYAASKFAVTGLTRSAALELGRRGVRVNSVHPGIIETPLVQSAPADVRARLQRVLDRQALPRMGTAAEVAYLVLFLASDESAYCTGAQFVIDGGHLAGPYREGFDDGD